MHSILERHLITVGGGVRSVAACDARRAQWGEEVASALAAPCRHRHHTWLRTWAAAFLACDG